MPSISAARRRSASAFSSRVCVPVVDAFDAGDGVAHDALGVIARNACPAHQRAGGSSQIVDRPVSDA